MNLGQNRNLLALEMEMHSFSDLVIKCLIVGYMMHPLRIVLRFLDLPNLGDV
jgi:hypothetical protein